MMSDGTDAVWDQVVDASVDAGAAIAYSKLNLAGSIVGSDIAAALEDPVAATAGLRTLGTGAQQAAAGNHTHPGQVSLAATVARVNANSATSGACTNPQMLNDGDTTATNTCNWTALNQIAEIQFNNVLYITRFRYFPRNLARNDDGVITISKYNQITDAWVAVDTVTIDMTTAAWSGWDTLATPFNAGAVRLTLTTVDSGGDTRIAEIQFDNG